jgi:carboxypeptidase D
MQVDTLNAAGAAAKIPSRIGKQQETLLGAVHPNGTTLSGSQLAAGEADSTSSDKDVTEDGYDVEHERYYGPRRTGALVFLLLLVVGAIWAILRWRTRRRQERYRRLKGKGRAVRLEERSSSASAAGRGGESEGRRSGAYRDRGTDPIPYEAPETVAVFDVGAESDEESDEERDSFEKDEESWGDLGRAGEGGGNPWMPAGGGRGGRDK